MIPNAAREYILTQAEIESRMCDVRSGVENALKPNAEDIAKQYNKNLRELKGACAEAMLELNLRASFSAIST